MDNATKERLLLERDSKVTDTKTETYNVIHQHRFYLLFKEYLLISTPMMEEHEQRKDYYKIPVKKITPFKECANILIYESDVYKTGYGNVIIEIDHQDFW